uniref:RNA replicase n=1 Tax=Beihai noda-like virus 20 TaxID=1922474 RepID=A0A1L3KFK7_9VIRU|nr:hypothetical protein 1 [Beihai noda-like virus 20]
MTAHSDGKYQRAAPTDNADGRPSLHAPSSNQLGVHTSGSPTSAPGGVKAGELVSQFLERLLIHDDRRDTQENLFAGDALRVPWLRTIAKLASREIEVLCLPVSAWARGYLQRELLKIKRSSVQGSTWWIKDRSTQVTGEERALRIASAIIRSETVSHAFDSTARKKVPKHQKQHDHSIFRQLAEGFTPPAASPEAIASTLSDHPTAGASRKVGVTAMRECLHNAGFRDFDPGKSGAARDAKAAGRRELHGVKDLQHANSGDTFDPGMVYTFVDQDMYIDNFAPYAGSNMVIVTPEYNKLAGVGTDSVWYYTLNADQEVVVTERVSRINGATYHNQRPWNYTANDFIYIEHPGHTAFTTYNVCIQYQAGSHHKWVWLARNTTTNLSKPVCDLMMNVVQGSPFDGVPLKKADNVVIVQGDSKLKQDTFLCGLFGESASPTYSIKYAYDMGPETSMELTENQYKVFNLMGKNRPKGYGVSEVKRTMQMHTIWRPGGLEPILVSYFGIPIEYRPQPNIMYTRQDGSLDDDVAEVGTATEGAPNAFGGGPGVADTKSDAAHDAYKKKRLEKYSNKIEPPAPFKEVLDMLLARFIDQVSGESGIALGSVTLCAPQVIFDRRTQALQAARLQRYAELLARPALPKTNLKNEVGPKASAAPRGITQLNEELAIQTGRVGLLIKEVLKHCGFFMPGGSPHDIATAIRNLTQLAMEASNDDEVHQVSGVHDTDYTKMDETISEYIYKSLFVKFVLAFVHPSDYEEVKKTLEDNVDITTMLNGKLVNTGYKNNSGSGVTTELNTLVAAFVEFVTTCYAITKYTYRLRHGKELDFGAVKKSTIRTALAYYSEHTTLAHIFWGDFMFTDSTPDIWSIPYAVIGPKFGDDGVGAHLPNISDADWNEAATYITGTIGMILKVSFSRPENGTFFLGRHYPRPLESLASYADVAKACRKISIARNGDIEKYKLKLHGYWTTDSKTPGIREYLIAVARMYDVDLHCYEGIVEVDDEGRPVLSKEMADLLANDKDMFYRVAGGPYCVEDDDVPMMLEAIATQINFESSSELESWLESLSKCATWEELDAFQIPGGDYDPDEEPECTVRMSGPAASLLAAGSSQPSEMADCSLDDLAAAAAVALQEGVVAGFVDEGEDTNASDSASSA